MVIFSKKRTSRHCSGVTSVASACGGCIDKVFSALSAAFNVTRNVCLTMLSCVREGDSGKGGRVMQKVIIIYLCNCACFCCCTYILCISGCSEKLDVLLL